MVDYMNARGTCKKCGEFMGWADGPPHVCKVDYLLMSTNASIYTFGEFAAINKVRCNTLFNHTLESWSLPDWFTAFIGEAGEAGNVLKKMNRLRDQLPDRLNKLSDHADRGTEFEELRQLLFKELGDTYAYFDLLCQAAGTSVREVATRRFDEVSQRMLKK